LERRVASLGEEDEAPRLETTARRPNPIVLWALGLATGGGAFYLLLAAYEPEPPVSVQDAPPPAPRPAAIPTPPVPPAVEPESTPPAPRAVSADANAVGSINANSVPPSSVVIDGRPWGTTPVTGVKVSPGAHTVVFIHPEHGSISRTVTVVPGRTSTAVVRFDRK
jgi:hypothetical protein